MLSRVGKFMLSQPSRQFATQLSHPTTSEQVAKPEQVPTDSKKFQLKMAIKNYAPDEVKVRVIDGYLVIEGKHEESGPQGKTTKEFTKWLKIPDDVDTATLEHTMNKDGVLSLTALKKQEKSL